MKRNLFALIIVTLAIMNLSLNSLRAQAPAFSNGLSIKAGGGLTTFFGDLGAQGLSVLNYTKAGGAGSAIKMFTPALGLQIQYFLGNLYSFRSDLAQYFNGSVQEISISARIDPLLLLYPAYSGKLYPYFRGGLGTTSFRAVRRDQNTNTVFLPAYGYGTDGLTKIARENALSIPLSAGLGFQLTDKISVELEQSISLTNTDILDAVVGTGTAISSDMFGFTQIGLKYTFGTTQTSVPREKKPRTTKTQTSRSYRDNSKRAKDQVSPDLTLDQIPASSINIFIESTIPEKPVSGKIFEVKIRINKGDYIGPAILTQIFPEGFTALESQLGYSQFSFINQKVRIIWERMPKDSIINYTYFVRPGEMVHGPYTLNGSLEYRLQDGPKLIQFANYIFVDNKIESDMDAQILKLLGDEKEEDNLKKDAVQEEKGDELELQIEDLLRKYGDKTTKETQVKDAGELINKHQAIKGIDFRIQCGAFRTQEEGRKTIRKYNISESVAEYYHNGLYKYTVGSFSTYEEAARYRDGFIQRSKIWTAFIVAYENGKRLNSLNQAFR